MANVLSIFLFSGFLRRPLNCCIAVILLVLIPFSKAFSQHTEEYIQRGWAELVKDRDDLAFRYFDRAYRSAKAADDPRMRSEALLYLGICSFGTSREEGMRYASAALYSFKKLEPDDPEAAANGRGRCLQLIATIYARQQKYERSLALSREAAAILRTSPDTTGTLGLAYSSIGAYHKRNGRSDSAAMYFRASLREMDRYNKLAYLPEAYVRLSQLSEGKEASDLLVKGLQIACSTGNRQAQVSCLLASGKLLLSEGNHTEAAAAFRNALVIARGLTDKYFEIRALKELIAFERSRGNYAEVAALQDSVLNLQDAFFSHEQEKITKNLEVRFEVAEKNRRIESMAREQRVSTLTNSLLAVGLVLLLILLAGGYSYYKVKVSLVESLQEQKLIREEQFRNDMEHRESQLSAITINMLEKNELLLEIRSLAEQEKDLSRDKMLKMIDANLGENAWNDFNAHFESVNRNFYNRLLERSPDISPNDLRLCALIRLNLSTKEMAAILNISPDSVKTARYRLRKKLAMPAEESLTNYILSL
jgi:DNA-binding CsgD family transcriptional regulator/uncharacterized membrane protein YciS (DUF1049 family)